MQCRGAFAVVCMRKIILSACSSFSPFHFIKQKAWFEMFLRFIPSQTYKIFLILLVPLAIPRNFRNWHQLFHNRSGSYKIHALSISIFLVHRFHGNIDYPKKHIQPNFNLISKSGVIFTSIRSRESW